MSDINSLIENWAKKTKPEEQSEAPNIEESETKSDFPPPDYVEPTILKCGHMNFVDEAKQQKAKSEGFCCEAQRTAEIRHRKNNPNTKSKSSLRIFWHVRGLYEPVPPHLRRTIEKERGSGYPGLCCDQETHLYIGGLGNNCLHYHEGKNKCVVHSQKSEFDPVPEE